MRFRKGNERFFGQIPETPQDMPLNFQEFERLVEQEASSEHSAAVLHHVHGLITSAAVLMGYPIGTHDMQFLLGQVSPMPPSKYQHTCMHRFVYLRDGRFGYHLGHLGVTLDYDSGELLQVFEVTLTRKIPEDN